MTQGEKNWHVGRLLEVSGSYWQGCALHAGVNLDVFSIIESGQTTADSIAGHLGADVRGTTALLDALAAMGLVVKRGDRYANTPFGRTFLVKSSPQYVGYMVMHHHHLVEAWARLDQAVMAGRPTRTRGRSDHEERESFLMGMFNLAMQIAPRLSGSIDLEGRRRLLDLGGGPGTYAIHFCLANPGLTAAVADLPTSRPFAEKTIARFHLSDRIRFVPCDYHRDDIPGAYDVVWLSHVLHGDGPDDCQIIIDKAAGALTPGGMMLIHDFILNDTSDGPLFPALFSLNMLVNTEKGRSYTESQIRDMMTKAGLARIKRLPFEGPNASGILEGIKD
jgi:SAM-dependent methyltransferase